MITKKLHEVTELQLISFHISLMNQIVKDRRLAIYHYRKANLWEYQIKIRDVAQRENVLDLIVKESFNRRKN